jgi:4-amino-4-deoxy-L-arabinose transferase-like glycosyltransferase
LKKDPDKKKKQAAAAEASGANSHRNFTESGAALYLLLFLAFILIFNDLSKPGLPSFDDCAKAQRAWEMIESGDYITPHLAGEPNFDHPPLYFWGLAISFKIFGKTEFAARFFGALCALLTVFVTFLIGKEVWSRNAGWWAAFFVSTSYMFLKVSRRVQTDIPFLLFTALALYFYIKGFRAIEANGAGTKKRALFLYFSAYGISVGISGLIKSVFVIFPLSFPLVFLLLTKKIKWKQLSYYICGALIGTALFSWWYIYELLKYGNVFIEKFFSEFLTGHIYGMSELGEFGPFGYIFEFLRHFWLWLPLALWAIWWLISNKKFKNRPLMQLLVIYILFPLIVLSFFGDKSIRYVMFLFPPILILTSVAIDEKLPKSKDWAIAKYPVVFLLLLSSFLIIRPIDWEDIRNEDYIVLRDLIEDNRLKLRNDNFYHYGEEYDTNRLPLLFYTGMNMRGVVNNRKEIIIALRKDKKFYLLAKKDNMTKFLKRRFEIVSELDERYLLFPKNIRKAKRVKVNR